MKTSFEKDKVRSVIQYEPIGIEFFHAYEDCCNMFQICGWFGLYEKHQGFDLGLTGAFSLSYDGQEVFLGDLVFQVFEESILASTRLPQEG